MPHNVGMGRLRWRTAGLRTDNVNDGHHRVVHWCPSRVDKVRHGAEHRKNGGHLKTLVVYQNVGEQSSIHSHKSTITWERHRTLRCTARTVACTITGKAGKKGINNTVI